jgi:CarD family transcriptional regulator
LDKAFSERKPFPHYKGFFMFSLNEKVVYPGHGVARISRIIERMVGSHLTSFFELKFLDSSMTILVPVENLSSIGVRKVSSDITIKTIFKRLSEPVSSNTLVGFTVSYGSNWGKRYKKYQGKIKTGDLLKICDIYRDLNCLSIKKELSFGEKGLLKQIEHLLAQEISIVTSVDEKQALAELRAQCKIGKQPAVAV